MSLARVKNLYVLLFIGFTLSSMLNSGCAKSNTDHTETNLSYLDSLAVLPIIFDSINEEALNYEASQARILDGCMMCISYKSRLKIQASLDGQIMIGHDITNNDILQAIIDFYDKEKIDLDRYSTARFMRFNDSMLNTEIYNIERYIKQLRKEEESHLDIFIAYKNEELKEYQRHKLYKTVLMLEELLIPYSYSYVQISAPDNCEVLEYILLKSIEAFYLLRDKESKKHFGQSYAHLFKRAKLDNDFNSTKEIEIIHTLIPVLLKRKREKNIEPPPIPL